MVRSPHQIGLLAEWLCVLRLTCTGWRILARRYKQRGGEIDLIARRGGVIAFIEVKARRNIADAHTAVTARQWHRIHQTAELWLAKQFSLPQLETLSLRFDLMMVGRWPWPHHIADAWRP